MSLRKTIIVAGACALAGCSTFPELDAVRSDSAHNGAFPALLPTNDLRATASVNPLPTDATVTARFASAATEAEAIDNRAASLKARAAGLRGEVIDAASKERLEDTIEIEEEDV